MEVGPRDGLQNESVFVSTQDKIALIEALVDTGLRRIEVTAFVSPAWIPPLADHMEVASGIKKQPGVSYAALVPNLKGFDRAMTCGIDEVSFVIAVTESHNKKNINASTEEAFMRYQEISKQAIQNNILFRAYLSCTFGCPYEGKINTENILEISKKLLDLGVYEIAFSDTIGVAHPKQTLSILEHILKIVPLEKIALHFHDTEGMALANIFAALSLGVSSFDASLAGMGGCPYAKGASGNVASEDLINMLNKMGLATNVDLEKMVNIAGYMEELLEKKLPSKMLRKMGACRVL